MSLSDLYPDIRPSLLLDFANTKALDPRITFSRASAAKYYDGVTFAKAEENLFVYSQDFTTSWGSPGTTVTADTEVAPDGTTTADTVTADAGTANHSAAQVITSVADTYTFSVFAKAGTHDYIQLRFAAAVGGSYVNFDLTSGAGAVGTSGGSGSPTGAIKDVGNDWYRCSITADISAGAATPGIILVTSSSAASAESWTALGTETVYLWGAQLEQRSALTDYTPTTDQPITNYVPALQSAAAGEARFDHDPVTGESLGFLIEEQRTNICLQSEDLSTTWTLGSSSIVTNTAVAPDGTLTADRIVEDATNNFHGINQSIAVVSGTTYTFSVYAKAYGNDFLRVGFNFARFGAVLAYFNISTGSLGTVTGGTATIVPAGNGWYRCSLTATCTSTGTSTHSLIYTCQSDNQNQYTGDGWSGLLAWGAQLEQASFPTSYIKTTSAQATRNADAASMTGTNFSEWFNPSAGTLLADYVLTRDSNSVAVADFNLGSGQNAISMRYASGAQAQYAITTNGSNQVNLASSGYSSAGGYKRAITYETNSFNQAINGALPNSEDTSGIVPVVNRLLIGAEGTVVAFFNNPIKKLAYYGKRLSNATLQALTEE